MDRFKQAMVVGLVFWMALAGLGHSLQASQPTIEKANWAALQKLAPGDTVLIALNGAQSFQGQFKTFTDEAVEVHLATGERAFPREKVFRVSTKVQSHRGRNALIGALAGAGAGLGIGAATDHGCTQIGCVGNLGKEVLTPLGALAGAIVGAVLPAGGWREVYRAR